ncbi:hypothetical protein LCGC14_0431360 [marine sediment metagenome]|uniref:Uncharacterized protein n=1 Tax=marine sediment metagenome TaxID=412755 RepID=A0A0F9VA71_9ZZZZ
MNLIKNIVNQLEEFHGNYDDMDAEKVAEIIIDLVKPPLPAPPPFPENHKGQWCYIQLKFCQEGICSDCQIYLDWINGVLYNDIVISSDIKTQADVEKKATEILNRYNLKCRSCGATSDVHFHNVYIGGQGDVRFPYCDDMVACSGRWNIQHGLPRDFSLEKK